MQPGRVSHWSHLVDVHPLEGSLQEFEVVDVFMLQFGLELDLLKTDAARKQHVHELTVRRSCNAEMISKFPLNRITQHHLFFYLFKFI